MRLSCAVSFDGKNRFTRFETSGGGSSGSGGGNRQASRACWSEAERKGTMSPPPGRLVRRIAADGQGGGLVVRAMRLGLGALAAPALAEALAACAPASSGKKLTWSRGDDLRTRTHNRSPG